MTYYLKYRPQVIEDLDIEEVRNSLGKMVKSGNTPHALLFAGPKGTGKTSAARILAKILNCEKTKKKGVPCNKCSQCTSITNGNNLDVIELDAASHRGIDDVRALRDAVKLAPAKAQKKVYIIDEAHMLTLEASNALLKTLEEPPKHVYFILATTNPEKLIETIRSRTLIITFRKANREEVARSINKIIKGEKIKLEKEAVLEIAKVANGSFRDAAKILEQIVREKKTPTTKFVKDFLVRTKYSDTNEFVNALLEKDIQKGIQVIETSMENGVLISDFMEAIMQRLRGDLLISVGVKQGETTKFRKEELIRLIEIFSQAEGQLKTSYIEQLPLELALIKWVEELQDEKIEEGGDDFEEAEKKKKEKVATPTTKVKKKVEKTKEVVKEGLEELAEVTQESWKMILERMRPINTSIEALLRATRPIGMSGDTLKLGVFYRFHKERLEEMKNKSVFEDVVASVIGKPIKVVCTLTETPPQRAQVVKKKETVLTKDSDKDIIKVAEEIFGG